MVDVGEDSTRSEAAGASTDPRRVRGPHVARRRVLEDVRSRAHPFHGAGQYARRPAARVPAAQERRREGCEASALRSSERARALENVWSQAHRARRPPWRSGDDHRVGRRPPPVGLGAKLSPFRVLEVELERALRVPCRSHRAPSLVRQGRARRWRRRAETSQVRATMRTRIETCGSRDGIRHTCTRDPVVSAPPPLARRSGRWRVQGAEGRGRVLHQPLREFDGLRGRERAPGEYLVCESDNR